MKNIYGDIERVKEDSKLLDDILQRQGSSLLIDVIVESCSRAANKFLLNKEDRERLVSSLMEDFKDAILERI